MEKEVNVFFISKRDEDGNPGEKYCVDSGGHPITEKEFFERQVVSKKAQKIIDAVTLAMINRLENQINSINSED